MRKNHSSSPEPPPSPNRFILRHASIYASSASAPPPPYAALPNVATIFRFSLQPLHLSALPPVSLRQPSRCAGLGLLLAGIQVTATHGAFVELFLIITVHYLDSLFSSFVQDSQYAFAPHFIYRMDEPNFVESTPCMIQDIMYLTGLNAILWDSRHSYREICNVQLRPAQACLAIIFRTLCERPGSHDF
jgi:hypothetical protein